MTRIVSPPRLSELGGHIQGTMLAVKHNLVELKLRLKKKRYPTPGDLSELISEVEALTLEVNRIGVALENYGRALQIAGIDTDKLQFPIE